MVTSTAALRLAHDGSLITRSGLKAAQNAHELRCFIDLLQRERVQRFLEIGSRHGDTLYDVMLSLPVGSMAVAVDLPGEPWGHGQSKNNLESVCDELRGRGYDIRLIVANSQLPETAAIVAQHGPFDAALIDGDHQYAGVKRDWTLYQRHARLVAFHDIVGFGQSIRRGTMKVEVPKLWREIRDDYRHCEFIDNGSKMGIGVLWTE